MKNISLTTLIVIVALLITIETKSQAPPYPNCPAGYYPQTISWLDGPCEYWACFCVDCSPTGNIITVKIEGFHSTCNESAEVIYQKVKERIQTAEAIAQLCAIPNCDQSQGIEVDYVWQICFTKFTDCAGIHYYLPCPTGVPVYCIEWGYLCYSSVPPAGWVYTSYYGPELDGTVTCTTNINNIIWPPKPPPMPPCTSGISSGCGYIESPCYP